MPTNLALDDKLIEEARRIGGHATKKDAVNAALDEYIRHRKQLECPCCSALSTTPRAAVPPPIGASTASTPPDRKREMMLLADASVWWLALRQQRGATLNATEERLRDEFAAAIRIGGVVMIGPVRQQLLAGVSEPAQMGKLRTALQAFRDEPLETSDYEEAARLRSVAAVAWNAAPSTCSSWRLRAGASGSCPPATPQCQRCLEAVVSLRSRLSWCSTWTTRGATAQYSSLSAYSSSQLTADNPPTFHVEHSPLTGPATQAQRNAQFVTSVDPSDSAASAFRPLNYTAFPPKCAFPDSAAIAARPREF